MAVSVRPDRSISELILISIFLSFRCVGVNFNVLKYSQNDGIL